MQYKATISITSSLVQCAMFPRKRFKSGLIVVEESRRAGVSTPSWPFFSLLFLGGVPPQALLEAGARGAGLVGVLLSFTEHRPYQGIL